MKTIHGGAQIDDVESEYELDDRIMKNERNLKGDDLPVENAQKR